MSERPEDALYVSSPSSSDSSSFPSSPGEDTSKDAMLIEPTTASLATPACASTAEDAATAASDASGATDAMAVVAAGDSHTTAFTARVKTHSKASEYEGVSRHNPGDITYNSAAAKTSDEGAIFSKDQFGSYYAVKPCKVLVVEDHEIMQLLVKTWLARLNIEAKYADDGLQAVKLAEEHTFDVIFMDLVMPVMDGIQASKIIRTSKTSRNTRTPIVAFSALALPSDLAINDFMNKPFGWGDIAAAIDKWGRHRLSFVIDGPVDLNKYPMGAYSSSPPASSSTPAVSDVTAMDASSQSVPSQGLVSAQPSSSSSSQSKIVSKAEKVASIDIFDDVRNLVSAFHLFRDSSSSHNANRPLTPSSSEVSALRPRHALTNPYESCTALVVEDDEITRQVLRDQLLQFKREVHTAADGEEAVQMCKEHLYDLILVDIELPKINGYEAICKIRQDGSLNRLSSVIAFTSQYEDNHQFFRELGIANLRSKPEKKYITSMEEVESVDSEPPAGDEPDDSLPDGGHDGAASTASGAPEIAAPGATDPAAEFALPANAKAKRVPKEDAVKIPKRKGRPPKYPRPADGALGSATQRPQLDALGAILLPTDSEAAAVRGATTAGPTRDFAAISLPAVRSPSPSAPLLAVAPPSSTSVLTPQQVAQIRRHDAKPVSPIVAAVTNNNNSSALGLSPNVDLSNRKRRAPAGANTEFFALPNKRFALESDRSADSTSSTPSAILSSSTSSSMPVPGAEYDVTVGRHIPSPAVPMNTSMHATPVSASVTPVLDTALAMASHAASASIPALSHASSLPGYVPFSSYPGMNIPPAQLAPPPPPPPVYSNTPAMQYPPHIPPYGPAAFGAPLGGLVGPQQASQAMYARSLPYPAPGLFSRFPQPDPSEALRQAHLAAATALMNNNNTWPANGGSHMPLPPPPPLHPHAMSHSLSFPTAPSQPGSQSHTPLPLPQPTMHYPLAQHPSAPVTKAAAAAAPPPPPVHSLAPQVQQPASGPVLPPSKATAAAATAPSAAVVAAMAVATAGAAATTASLQKSQQEREDNSPRSVDSDTNSRPEPGAPIYHSVVFKGRNDPPTPPPPVVTDKVVAMAQELVQSNRSRLDPEDAITYPVAMFAKNRMRQPDTPKSVTFQSSRETHNAKEQFRRKEMSDCVEDLRKIVPGCHPRADKANALKQAVHFLLDAVLVLQANPEVAAQLPLPLRVIPNNLNVFQLEPACADAPAEVERLPPIRRRRAKTDGDDDSS
ncbi:hypothetical protein CAOG_03378 [Capsaspora owczarzaki ATCC 30864]|uniref:Response regulatory domain-containing protein n=1 Tax=Capsaspora owczarzaki (strain ATCC 30864) TaxID=595528 RepID=A0A0D2WN04_CAPO3|nr:hypothetical protein CAOG_03378 [Capsaspora owczarzaki ATCC 30864]KJE92400.1 hypothetical protein CAOG_003378 [Capsaspora owczarzaki ATCC 30864]|eukprot:XP_004364217.1 hypothetical protein CAOG_03378 [Capsaspora owczarzaki ATCC 30864]